MFENIEDYYIVRISNLKSNHYEHGNFSQERVYEFACVKQKNGYYKDLITNEKYSFGTNFEEDTNSNFIDSDYSLIPLTDFINVSDSEMIKEQLIKLVSVILSELNEKLLNNPKEISKKMI